MKEQNDNDSKLHHNESNLWSSKYSEAFFVPSFLLIFIICKLDEENVTRMAGLHQDLTKGGSLFTKYPECLINCRLTDVNMKSNNCSFSCAKACYQDKLAHKCLQFVQF